MRSSAPPRDAAMWVVCGSVLALAGFLWLWDLTAARVAAGLLAAVVGPGAMAASFVDVPALTVGARYVAGIAFAVLALMVEGALASMLMPLVGVSRPLEGVWAPAISIVVMLVVALLGRRRRVPLPNVRPTRMSSFVVVAIATLLVPISAMSSVRLNNGFGPEAGIGVLTVALGLAAFCLARRTMPAGAAAWALYCVGLAVIWLTSLRGWSITGHDIQREFYVFRLAEDAGRWSPGSYRDAYNACLSLNVLPVILSHMTGLSGVVIFKAFMPAMFAMVCPIVYWIGVRVRDHRTGTAAAVLMISLPPFVNDMAFLARQEVALVFVALIALIVVSGPEAVRRRRMLLGACGVGSVLAHYSTTYILVGTSALALIVIALGRVVRSWSRTSGTRQPRALVVPVVSVIALVAAAWSGPLTGTSGFLTHTIQATVSSFGSSNPFANRSGDVGYSVVGGTKETPQQRLEGLWRASLRETSVARDRGEYLPLSARDREDPELVEEADLPRTTLGRGIAGVGLSPERINYTLRDVLSKVYQLALFLGVLVAAVWGRATIARFPEYWALGLASVVVVALQVVLPAISLNYGVMRAFLQGMIFFGPLVVLGIASSVAWAGRRASVAAVVVVPLCAFASLTGLLPTALGGYPPQLNLHNAGLYYTAYYTDDTDLAAARWVYRGARPGAVVQPEVQVDRVTLSRMRPEIATDEDAFPPRVRSRSTVLLGTPVVRDGVAKVALGGDFLLYRYPREMIQRHRNLVYSNGSVEAYGD